MFIKTNTKRKVEKILEGKVFDSPYVFITELLQNAYRAKCENVSISITNSKFTFEDDGCGLKKPESLLTFDTSEWNTTDEGFGIGFWSVLGVPKIKSIEILSNNYRLFLDIESLKDNLEVDVSETEGTYKGFKVILESDFFIKEKSEIINIINEEGEFLPFNIYLNDFKITQGKLMDTVYGDFVKEYNNRLFTAKLSVSRHSSDHPNIYYEYRNVKKFYNASFITGIIHLKKNAVDLKEPDRKAIVFNDKYYKFEDKLNECINDIYKSFLTEIANDSDLVDNYSLAIANHLSAKDFENLLLVEDNFFELDINSKIKSIINEENEVNEKEALNLLNKSDNSNWEVATDEVYPDIIIDKETEDNSEVEINNVSSIKIGDKVFIKTDKYKDKEEDNHNGLLDANDFEVYNNEDINVVQNRSIDIIENTSNKVKLKEFLKKKKLVLWVRAGEVSRYTNAIGMAKYNGIEVMVSKNELFDLFFEEKKVKHISEIENCITEEYKIVNTVCKTTKEESFLILLEPIRKHFKLKPNTFRIGDIYSKSIITINNKRKVNISKNSANKVSIYGVACNDYIVLDRKALELKRFNISLEKDYNSIGKNELKCLFYNINTIAHELAHLLYKTTDNTEYHFKMERYLIKEITNLYMNY